MSDTNTVNGYVLNNPGRPAPWSATEYEVMEAFASYLPTKGSYLTTQHLHSNLYDPATDTAAGVAIVDLGSSRVSVNENGTAYAFIVKNSIGGHVLSCDPSTNRVGINQVNPTTAFDVVGNGLFESSGAVSVTIQGEGGGGGAAVVCTIKSVYDYLNTNAEIGSLDFSAIRHSDSSQQIFASIIGFVHDQAANGDGMISFRTTNNGVSGARLVISHDGLSIYTIKSGATQLAAGALVRELWKTSGHASLPDNVLMIGV